MKSVTKTNRRAGQSAANLLKATDLLMRLLQSGVARFDPATKEFCCNGLRYSCSHRDWTRLVAVIGQDQILELLKRVNG